MPKWKIQIGILCVAVLFGFGFVAMKYLLGFLDPKAVVFIRIASAALVFAPFALKRWPRRKVAPRDIGLLILSGFLGVALNQFLFVEGLQLTTPSHSSLINAAIPVLTLMYAVFFGHERAGVRRVLGFLVSLAGLAYLMEVDHLQFSSRALLGDIMTFGNANSYAIYLVVARPLSARYSSYWIMAILFWIGLGFLAPIGVPALLQSDFASLPLPAWGAMAYVVVGITIFTYGLVTWLLRHTTSSHISQGIYFQPIIAVSASALLLGEAISPRLFLAAGLVLGGVALTQLGRRAARSA